jgi:hypothetical protein
LTSILITFEKVKSPGGKSSGGQDSVKHDATGYRRVE